MASERPVSQLLTKGTSPKHIPLKAYQELEANAAKLRDANVSWKNYSDSLKTTIAALHENSLKADEEARKRLHLLKKAEYLEHVLQTSLRRALSFFYTLPGLSSVYMAAVSAGCAIGMVQSRTQLPVLSSFLNVICASALAVGLFGGFVFLNAMNSFRDERTRLISAYKIRGVAPSRWIGFLKTHSIEIGSVAAGLLWWLNANSLVKPFYINDRGGYNGALGLLMVAITYVWQVARVVLFGTYPSDNNALTELFDIPFVQAMLLSTVGCAIAQIMKRANKEMERKHDERKLLCGKALKSLELVEGVRPEELMRNDVMQHLLLSNRTAAASDVNSKSEKHGATSSVGVGPALTNMGNAAIRKLQDKSQPSVVVTLPVPNTHMEDFSSVRLREYSSEPNRVEGPISYSGRLMKHVISQQHQLSNFHYLEGAGLVAVVSALLLLLGFRKRRRRVMGSPTVHSRDFTNNKVTEI